MSDLQSTINRPQHHEHTESEPLPGARGAAPAADYTPATIERAPSGLVHDTNPGDPETRDFARSGSEQGKTAFNSDRPLNTKPTSEGGVAIDGRDNLPEGKAGFGDKVVGKTQKVIGKYTHKPDLHEKGELREAGGKAAALGDARAPHD